MKRIFIAAIGLSAIVSSCKKDVASDVQKPFIAGPTVDTIWGNISANLTLTKTTYLDGIVYVNPGVTLTVNPGVIIKGSLGPVSPDPANLRNNKGTLIVEQGGKLTANGTATSPIVWTSENPSGSRNFGDWGGIVILGKAPIKAATGTIGAGTNIYEAFQTAPWAAYATKNTYGGTDAADNSGSLTYNRIEFAGGVVTVADKEVNGLTLAGVGNGTVLHHVEVANSGDDAFEFFGGRVNAHHLLAYNSKDDDFDFDEFYQGNLQFIIAYRFDLADNSGSEMIELDSYAATAGAGEYSLPFIANATLIGPTVPVRAGVTGNFAGAIYVRDAGRVNLVNSLIVAQNFPSALAAGPQSYTALMNSGTLSNSSEVRNNIFQVSSATAVIANATNGYPISGPNDVALINVLGNATNKNTALGTFAAFKLNGVLQPLTGSPALSGGLNLTAMGVPGFVGTTARGAVIPGDAWTSAAWLSVANN